MKPAIDLVQLASNLVVSTVKREDDEDPEKDCLFQSADGLEWVRYSVSGGSVDATYKIPGSNANIEREMQRYLKNENLFMAYLPLDFFTLPMWPRHAKDWKSAFDSIFYLCVQCDTFVGAYAQLCMQFFLPSTMKVPASPLGGGGGTSFPWAWIPRLLCRNCTTHVGSTLGESLTYYPFCMYAQRAIAGQMDTALRKMRSSRAIHALEGDQEGVREGSECLMCLQPLRGGGKKKRKKKGRFCGHECKASWDVMMELKEEGGKEEVEITGLFQLLELFDVMQTYRVDINGALCWRTVCNHIEGHRNDPKSGHFTGQARLCKQCHRVAYCSKKCVQGAKDTDQHHCTRNWREVFVASRLCIQKE